MLATLWNGSGPFTGRSLPEIKNNTINRPIDVSRLPKSLAPLVASMAAKNFKDRPTAQAVLNAPFFQTLSGSES